MCELLPGSFRRATGVSSSSMECEQYVSQLAHQPYHVSGVGWGICVPHCVWSENGFRGLALSFYYVGPGDETQIIDLATSTFTC